MPQQPLSLPEELILLLLDDNSGYFHQIPGWSLNCAVIGAVLAELSFLSRLDTDLESLYLTDQTKTGNTLFDPILKEIAQGPAQQNTRYWIERLIPYADSVITLSLENLVAQKILKHHDGDFWTLISTTHTNLTDQFVRRRIRKYLFTEEIPDSRDIILIVLLNTCDVFRFMFELDEKAEERVKLFCQIDLIGRSIAEAVETNIANPLLRQPSLTKKIPIVGLHKLLLNQHLRTGNLPALFADLAQTYGPVFQLRLPFKEPLIFLAGSTVNRWAHRKGRMYLRARDYFTDIEKVYGASGLIPSLDGAEHFQLRKAMQPGYSRARLMEQLDTLYSYIRGFVADWKVGTSLHAASVCRLMINAQVSPLVLSISSQDIVEDLIKFKERALITHVAQILPRFMLHTPSMKRAAKAVEIAVQRIQNCHTPRPES